MFEAFRCQAPPLRAAAARAASTLPEPTAAPAAATPPRAAKKRRTQGGGAAPPPPAGVQQPAGLALEKMGDQPLRLVIVGHNPSEHAWSSGHFYSNPSNWMWRILRDTGIAPVAAIRGAQDDGRMPEVAGVGFTDVGGGNPGTDSSQFGPAHFAAWRPAFFQRLDAQARRASAAIGCTCGRCGAPAVVAFSGKKQFQELFAPGGGGGSSRGRQKQAAGAAGGGPLGSPQQPAAAAAASAADASAAAASSPGAAAAAGEQSSASSPDGSSGSAAGGSSASADRLPALQARRPSSIATGRQWVLPEGWPLPLSTEVWVMTSTSGAAPMTREQRYAPWQALAERLAGEPWPRQCQLRCGGSADG